MSHRYDRTIDVGTLARVEGEGALHVTVRDGTVEDLQLQIYEPPRFFEGLLRGRHFTEPPDVTARICGICPIAYQLTASQALEDVCQVLIPDPIRDLRRLLYCGEWIQSHVLHVFFLHAPDFLGMHSALDLADTHPETLRQALALRGAGNSILEAIGGRAVHPVTLRLGGFQRVPAKSDLRALLPRLEAALTTALDAVAWVGTFDFPDIEHDFVQMSLTTTDRYPIEAGTIVTSDHRAFDASTYLDHVVEQQLPHATALYATLVDGTPFVLGPSSRFSLNAERLPARAAEAARAVGLTPPARNPFRSIVVRAVEIVAAIEDAIGLIERYTVPDRPYVDVQPMPGVGYGVTEAPRGILHHRYELAEDGTVTAAIIVPPTSQNQHAIEADVRRVVEQGLDLDETDLQRQCEQAIRNHDPCISCATHFLDLQIDRA